MSVQAKPLEEQLLKDSHAPGSTLACSESSSSSRPSASADSPTSFTPAVVPPANPPGVLLTAVFSPPKQAVPTTATRKSKMMPYDRERR